MPPTATTTPTATPTETPTIQPTLTSVPSSTSDEGVVYIEASESILSLWNQWNGKYVLYAHRKSNIRELADLNGMVLCISVLGSSFFDMLLPASDFAEAAGMQYVFDLDMDYDKWFLEDSRQVGFMLAEVAEFFHFDENENLERIEFK